MLDFTEFSTFLPSSVNNSNSTISNQNIFLSPKLLPKEVFQSARRSKSVNHLLSSIKFNCSTQAEGYYADVDFDCRLFHYCKDNQIRFTFHCPAESMFNQRSLTCDNSVANAKQSCKDSSKFYYLNLVLYKDKKIKNAQDTILKMITSSLNETMPTISSTSSSTAASDSDVMVSFPGDHSHKWSAIEVSKTSTRKNAFNSKTSDSPNKFYFEIVSSSTTPTVSSSVDTLVVNDIDVNDDPLSTSFSVLMPSYVSTTLPSSNNQIESPDWFSEWNDLSNPNVDESPSTNVYTNYQNSVPTSSPSTTEKYSHSSHEPTSSSQTPPETYVADHSSHDLSTASPRKVPPPRYYRVENRPRPIKSARNKPRPSQSVEFAVDWDDSETWQGSHFVPSQLPTKSPVTSTDKLMASYVNDDNGNYLYGKPIESLPPFVNVRDEPRLPTNYNGVPYRIPQLQTEVVLPNLNAATLPKLNLSYNPASHLQNYYQPPNSNGLRKPVKTLFNMLGNQFNKRRWTFSRRTWTPNNFAHFRRAASLF